MIESPRPNCLLNRVIKILIICEGQEDYLYIKKLISLNVWNPSLKVEAKDAHGNGNIYEAYKQALLSGFYQLVFIYCDTENEPYETFKMTKRKINSLYYGDDVFLDISFFANPVTMQIMILHIASVKIESTQKADYQDIVKQYFGVSHYFAEIDKINKIMSQINEANYQDLKRRLKEFYSDDYTLINRTNFLKLLNYLEDENTDWSKSLIKETMVKTKLV